MSKIDTVILAAGMSKRLGFNKLCVRLNGKAVVRRTVEVFVENRLPGKIVVVTGFQRERVEQELAGLPIDLVHNPGYEEGMSTSLKAALPHVTGADLVLFHLGDKPFVGAGTIRTVLESYEKERRCFTVPVYQGVKGHPVLMENDAYASTVRGIEGDRGLRGVVEAHGAETLFVEADEGVIMDVDTEEDIALLRRRGYIVEKG